jgi:hypothetical protein
MAIDCPRLLRVGVGLTAQARKSRKPRIVVRKAQGPKRADDHNDDIDDDRDGG